MVTTSTVLARMVPNTVNCRDDDDVDDNDDDVVDTNCVEGGDDILSSCRCSGAFEKGRRRWVVAMLGR